MSLPSVSQSAAFRGPIRVCGPVDTLHVFLGKKSPRTHVCALSVRPLPDCFHRVRAYDLRDAQRQSTALRTSAGRTGCTVFVDVEVTVDRDVRKALDAAEVIGPARAGEGPVLRYVGTPRGLAGYIGDLHRLGIADGVTLRPRRFAAPTQDSIDEVLHALSA